MTRYRNPLQRLEVYLAAMRPWFAVSCVVVGLSSCQRCEKKTAPSAAAEPPTNLKPLSSIG